MVLFSPGLDLTYSRPGIEEIFDPVLDLAALRQSGIDWAGDATEASVDDLAVTDPLVSPLYGSLEGLPPTYVYTGSMEYSAINALALQDKALATPGSDFTFILRKGQIHDWALATPITLDGLLVQPQVYRQLLGD